MATNLLDLRPASAAGPSEPDGYQDHDAIRDLVHTRLDEWKRGRDGFLRSIWRNILFYRGHQWIVFDRGLDRWRPARLRRNTPTPVTNLYASTIDAVMSVLARFEPTLTFRPGTAEPEDRATADVAGRAVEVIEEEVRLRIQRQYLATWVTLAGGAWIETGYDPDPIHGVRFLQHEQCIGCRAVFPPEPACPACGGKLAIPAFDETMRPIGEYVSRGKMFVEVVSPFEMYFNAALTDWSKHRELIRQKGLLPDEAKRRWPKFADQITPDSMTHEAQLYAESLTTLAGNIDDTQGPWGIGTTARPLGNTQVTETWFWALPSPDYPKGLLTILLGRTLVAYAGPLPYTERHAAEERRPFLPFVFFPQKLVPGTVWPKTVADDLALLAAKHNRLEAMIELILMRTASPVWLNPSGSNVRNLTGEAGQVIDYNAVGPAPAKPERIPGQGIPAGVIHYLEKLEEWFDDVAATFDVIRGARPEGVSAGIALQILQERGMSRFGPMFILWSFAWAEWAKQALEIFREFATEERLLRIQGRDGRWQVQKFLGADLQGRIDVVPEAISSLPRSSLLERAEMEQLAALGIINVQDPEVRYKFLQVYGRTNLTPGMAADAKNAVMENEAFRALAQHPAMATMTPEEVGAIQLLMGTPDGAVEIQRRLADFGLNLPRVRPGVDDHGIHSREHGNELKSETAQGLPPIVQLLWEAHKAEHDRLAAQQMQVMMAMRGGQLPFLQAPPGAQTSPANAGSSGKRMEGDFREMAGQMTGGEAGPG